MEPKKSDLRLNFVVLYSLCISVSILYLSRAFTIYPLYPMCFLTKASAISLFANLCQFTLAFFRIFLGLKELFPYFYYISVAPSRKFLTLISLHFRYFSGWKPY